MDSFKSLSPHPRVSQSVLLSSSMNSFCLSQGHDIVPRLALERALMPVFSLSKLLLAVYLFLLTTKIYAVLTSNHGGMKLNFCMLIGENCVGTFLAITGPILR